MIIYLLWTFVLPYLVVSELMGAAVVTSSFAILATPLLSTGIIALGAIEGLFDDPKVYWAGVVFTYIIGVIAGYVAVYA